MSPHLAADQPRPVLVLPQEPTGEQAEARRPAAGTWQGVTVAADGQGQLRGRFPPSQVLRHRGWRFRQGCRVRVAFAVGLPAGGGGGEELGFLAHVGRGWVARPRCSGTTDLWNGPSARCWDDSPASGHNHEPP